ncbi:Putative NSDC [Aspergillus calidoustus]|uniref:Putative NSDC n=1 Tax=Aspergillus calidoustus TaxID=454130 RepID=A0A0U5GNS8_ASPCI|nr:Putative NSDC [Aspergillus calidoustus]
MISVHAATAYSHQPFHGSAKHPGPMAALMQSNNEPVAVSNPLPAPSNPSDSVAFLKQSKPDSSLTSIASAGLNVTRSKESLPTMSTMATNGSQPSEPQREQKQNSSQVAREALEQPSVPISDPLPSDQMQVDAHPVAGDAHEPVFNTADNGTSLMNTSTVASPGPIEDSISQDGDRPRHRHDSELHQDNSNKAFSYPMPTGGFNDPRRGLSLPSSGLNKAGQRSPSAKKHRCPYCATEFTRHHNLKSHLLTHSQEKPFVCQTCQSRFRRLHDLKRHTKLHTGERPHICPKCGRRFARGDALARHNKGQGGCAGRRASMGSYAPEDEYGDGGAAGAEDAMDGLMYAEPERMDEDEERRYNMPSIKKHDLPTDSIARSNSASSYQPRQTNTYPPIAASRPSPGGLFPPPTSHGGSSGSPSPISQAFPSTNPPTGFAPPNVTESPRPLSPNALSSHQMGHGSESNVLHHRPHSPGITHSFSQYSRAGPSQPTPSLGLPPPQPGAPQLPPPPGLGSSEPRFSLHAQSSVQPPPTTAKHTPSHSHSSNHPPPETIINHASHDPSLFEQQRDQVEKLWTYIRSVQDEVTGLRAELATLKAQMASTSGNALATPSSGVVQPQAEGTTSAVQR